MISINKILTITVLSIVIIIVLIFWNANGKFAPLNKPITYIFSGPVDYSCEVDSDCIMSGIACEPRNTVCGVVHNKDWEATCIFRVTGSYAHVMPICNYEIKCINNRCEAIEMYPRPN